MPVTRSLHDYLTILKRRKAIVVVAFLILPVAAFVWSSHEQKLYEANSQVLIQPQSLADQLSGTPSAATSQTFGTVLSTQASLARALPILQRVKQSVGVSTPVAQLLQDSSVGTQVDTDLLEFAFKSPDPQTAQRLVNAYAQQFIASKRKLDTASLRLARGNLAAKLSSLRGKGGNAGLIAGLESKDQQLSTLEALQTSNASVATTASSADLVQPRTMRNVIIAVILGVGLAAAAALLADAIDRRVRTTDEVEEQLGIPLLARMPWPRRRGSVASVTTLDDPTSTEAEAYRLLRANLEFMAIDSGLGTLIVTSAVGGEGKSTTATNLAVASARGGRSVVLVDLDLRKPRVAALFDIPTSAPGLTNVLLDQARLEHALTEIPIANESSGIGVLASPGSLLVLPAGPTPPNPGEICASHHLQSLLNTLRETADIVIIDTPPMVLVGDALAVSGSADGILVVSRLGFLRRPFLRDLHRLLDNAPVPALGYVVTGAVSEQRNYYEYAAYAEKPSPPSPPFQTAHATNGTSTETPTHPPPRPPRP